MPSPLPSQRVAPSQVDTTPSAFREDSSGLTSSRLVVPEEAHTSFRGLVTLSRSCVCSFPGDSCPHQVVPSHDLLDTGIVNQRLEAGVLAERGTGAQTERLLLLGVPSSSINEGPLGRPPALPHPHPRRTGLLAGEAFVSPRPPWCLCLFLVASGFRVYVS